jgi:hypothetical protein
LDGACATLTQVGGSGKLNTWSLSRGAGSGVGVGVPMTNVGVGVPVTKSSGCGPCGVTGWVMDCGALEATNRAVFAAAACATTGRASPLIAMASASTATSHLL